MTKAATTYKADVCTGRAARPAHGPCSPAHVQAQKSTELNGLGRSKNSMGKAVQGWIDPRLHSELRYSKFAKETTLPWTDCYLTGFIWYLFIPQANAMITIAIWLRYDYDPTTMHRARLLPFDVSKKWTCQFFVVVVSQSNQTYIVIS